MVATGGMVLGGRDEFGVGKMEIELYDPLNPALTAILNGNRMRAISLAEAQRAKAIYMSIVAVGPERGEEHLKDFPTSEAKTIKTFTSYGPRWTGVMEVVSGHVLPHEFGWTDPRTDQFYEGAHDMNLVLEML